MSLADHLARALAKYQEAVPWDDLTDQKKARHIRLGSLLAGDLMKHVLASPLPTTSTPQTPSPPSVALALAASSLSPEAAVEVSVAVPLTVGGVTGALSPKSVQTIFAECLKQIGNQQKEQTHEPA